MLLNDIKGKGFVPYLTNVYMAASYIDSLSELLFPFILAKIILFAIYADWDSFISIYQYFV